MSILLAVIILIVLCVIEYYGMKIPHPSAPIILSMETLMDKYIYKFGIPAPKSTDVVTRELHIVIDETETMVELGVDVSEFEYTLDEGSNVSMYLIDIDGAGNRSEQGDVLTFTVLDIVPPEAPAAPVINDISVFTEPTN